MGLPRFGRPKGLGGDESTPNLYVANCGPAVGVSSEAIASVFGIFGELNGVYAADESGTRVIISFIEKRSAQEAFRALNKRHCTDLGGRFLHIQYSIVQPPKQVSRILLDMAYDNPALHFLFVSEAPSLKLLPNLEKVRRNDSTPVCLVASELKIPGLHLWHDFISAREEEELLAAVDDRLWRTLAKRRVQHYGYEFLYETRNVNTRQKMGELPSFVSPILAKISSISDLDGAIDKELDQLTVNEYPSGVGLSPHIDTHSAFEGPILSLSLAGPCIMEFRRFSDDICFPQPGSVTDSNMENPQSCSSFIKRVVYLPPRSMLLLSGEARYAWHHYIPHHKVDFVKDDLIRRGPRRVSFTFRKVRTGPCNCGFPQYCDSQR